MFHFDIIKNTFRYVQVKHDSFNATASLQYETHIFSPQVLLIKQAVSQNILKRFYTGKSEYSSTYYICKAG